MGYSTARDLGILRVGQAETVNTGNCDTVDDSFVGQLKAKYPSVFQGIGKLKNYQLKLHIDPRVTPVVQKERRVPFSLKNKVTAKVNELLEQDIIERVQAPTAWASPNDVAPKASDMRNTSQII